jgi:hypothetical protein
MVNKHGTVVKTYHIRFDARTFVYIYVYSPPPGKEHESVLVMKDFAINKFQ